MKFKTNTTHSECDSPSYACLPNASRRRFLVTAGTLMSCLAARPLMAAGSRQSYADLIQAHPSLRGYWAFDGNLADGKGKANGETSGVFSYVGGPVAGKALSLVPNAPVVVQNTKALEGRSATLQFFFKLDAAPKDGEDVMIIAQATGDLLRYKVGIKHDLSALTYEQDLVPTTVLLPSDKPIEVGRWYHLAITSSNLDLRIYLDGQECSLFGGAFDFTKKRTLKNVKESLPLVFGASAPDGQVSAPISLDEVVYLDKTLSIEEIRSQLEVAGWSDRMQEIGIIAERVDGKRQAQRAEKLEDMLDDPALFEHGQTRVYEGEHLGAISFTVGGIGSGGIQFNGKAEPAIWQIGGNFQEKRVADSFLAIRAQSAGGKPVVRALQTEPVGSFAAMSALTFEGEYPFAKYNFEEPALPVEVEFEVFNPLIPMDLKHSAIPCAIYTVRVSNPSNSPVKVDLLAAQQNAIGYEGKRQTTFGGNTNTIVREGGATHLHMTQPESGADMVLMTLADGASATADWNSSASLHSEFSQNGALAGLDASKPSPPRKTVNGALAAPLELAPGESKSVTFVLTWNYTKVKHGGGTEWVGTGFMYNNWWPDAMGVAAYLRANLDDLTARTHLFHDTLYASNIPVWLIDRLSSQLAVLRSQSCWWAKNGVFGVFEGCGSQKGCCEGNCTHVLHYAQAHARIFPELGRLMRSMDFEHLTPEGLMPYRYTHDRPATDGHFGTLLNSYREHLCNSDDVWLKQNWPQIKIAMEAGIKEWDPNRDGYLQNRQHNTLDCSMDGCSSWIGSIYLTTLEAAARMADVAGEPDTAKEYRRIRASGQKMQNERLWNGEYYIQEAGEKRALDYLDGCHIDQILGEWWADQIDIDRNYPAERSKQAMQSLLKYNFYSDFIGQSLKPRQYVTTEDSGMKMITWPKNAQPTPGMHYGDECMTGFEYGAGVSMIQNGLQKEGLMVLKATADRYDGRLRTDGITDLDVAAWGYTGNPFGDDECGKFYVRSMSVWSALLALQGFIYDGPAGCIGFRPRWKPEDHVSFFTVADGYGLYSQTLSSSQLNASLKISEGEVTLNELILNAGEGKQAKSATVTLEGQTLTAKLDTDGSDLKLAFPNSVVVKANETLDIQIQLG